MSLQSIRIGVTVSMQLKAAHTTHTRSSCNSCNKQTKATNVIWQSVPTFEDSIVWPNKGPLRYHSFYLVPIFCCRSFAAFKQNRRSETICRNDIWSHENSVICFFFVKIQTFYVQLNQFILILNQWLILLRSYVCCSDARLGKELETELTMIIIKCPEQLSWIQGPINAKEYNMMVLMKMQMKIMMKMKIGDGSHQYCHWPHFLVAFLLDQINHIYYIALLIFLSSFLLDQINQIYKFFSSFGSNQPYLQVSSSRLILLIHCIETLPQAKRHKTSILFTSMNISTWDNIQQ